VDEVIRRLHRWRRWAWAGLLALFFPLAPDAWNLTPVLRADRLQASGFETNNLTATEWTSTIGTQSLNAGTAHAGTYSMRVNPSSASGGVQRSIAASALLTSGSIYLKFYWLAATLPNVEARICETRSSGGTSAMAVSFNNASGVLRVENNVASTTQDGTFTPSTGTWYRIEFDQVISDSAGSGTARIYTADTGTVLDTITLSGGDTVPTDIGGIRFGHSGVAGTSDMYFDDVVINSSAGVAPFNAQPGDGKIALLKPTSNDTVTWTKTGANCSGTTNTDCVDDEPGTPDDASGYNAGSTANSEDRLNSASLPAEVPSDADMISLTVYDRWDGNGTSGTRQGRHLIWDEASAQSNGPTHTRCDVTAGNWSLAATTQITAFNLGTRTKANVESFDLGYEPLNNNECRVTAIWGNVEWKPAPAVTARRRRPVVW
jgi:hypothetical protein